MLPKSWVKIQCFPVVEESEPNSMNSSKRHSEPKLWEDALPKSPVFLLLEA
jgi:hypothetical protein